MNTHFKLRLMQRHFKSAATAFFGVVFALIGALAPTITQAQVGASAPVQKVQVRQATPSTRMSNLAVQCASGQYIGGVGADGLAVMPLSNVHMPCLVKAHAGVGQPSLFALLDASQPLLLVDTQSTVLARGRLGQLNLENYFDQVQQLVPHLNRLMHDTRSK